MTFQPGNKLGGRTPGSKNKETLAKEERRAIFEQRASEMWEDVISKLPPQYIADQFMGKAPDKIEHTIENKEPAPDIKELADELLSKQRGTPASD